MLAGEFIPAVLQRPDLVGDQSDAYSYFSGYPLTAPQWTMASKSLGQKVNGKRVSVIAFAWRGASAQIVSSATIGGVAATIFNGPNISSASRYTKTAFIVADTGAIGDLADIVINFSGVNSDISLGLAVPYRVCGDPIYLPHHRNQAQGASDPLTVNHKILKGGISIGIETISGESWGDCDGFSPSYTIVGVNNVELGDIIRMSIGMRQPTAVFDGNTSALFSTAHDQTIHLISF